MHRATAIAGIYLAILIADLTLQPGPALAAKNKDAAVKLLEFLVSDEAQNWYAETNNEFPVRDDVPSSKLLQSWGDFKADDIALDQLGIHNAEAVRLMDRAGWK